MVGIVKPYLMQRNLFGVFALTGGRDPKTLDVPEPPGGISIT